ncbi:hypothetical protein [Planctellipticum variicoloris]
MVHITVPFKVNPKRWADTVERDSEIAETAAHDALGFVAASQRI